MDDLLLAFVKDNFVTISLALGVLKAIALETPWAIDDKIIQIFTEFSKRK